MKVFSLTALLAIACSNGTGSGTDAGNDGVSVNPGETPTCTITLSGAVTGTYDCRPATVVWSAANDTGDFVFVLQSPSVAVGIGWQGEPAAGVHYKHSDATSTGGVTITTGSGATTQAWAATAADNSNPPKGSFDLSFSSVSDAFATSSGKAYTADGVLAATLVPLTGQSENITASITF